MDWTIRVTPEGHTGCPSYFGRFYRTIIEKIRVTWLYDEVRYFGSHRTNAVAWSTIVHDQEMIAGDCYQECNLATSAQGKGIKTHNNRLYLLSYFSLSTVVISFVLPQSSALSASNYRYLAAGVKMASTAFGSTFS